MRKTTSIRIRCTVEKKARWVEAAGRHGMDLSKYTEAMLDIASEAALGPLGPKPLDVAPVTPALTKVAARRVSAERRAKIVRAANRRR